MNPADSSTAPSLPPPSSPAVVHFLRWLAFVCLTLGLGFVGGLFLVTQIPPLHGLFGDLLGSQARLPSLDAGLPVALAVLVLTPLAIGYAYRRLRPITLRRGVFIGLLAATALVANLVLVAFFPSVREGLEALVWLSFWKANGAVIGLSAFTLLAIGSIAWWQRPSTLRDFVRFGLAVGFILTLDLVLVALCPSLLDAIDGLPHQVFNVDYFNSETFALLLLVAALIGLTPLAVLALAWQLRLHSWRWIGGGYLVLVPLLAYLALDDPALRRPVTMEEFSPAFPGAEKSFAVLMRYGNHHPLGRDFKSPQRIFNPSPVGYFPGGADKPVWREWLLARRADVEADWADLAPCAHGGTSSTPSTASAISPHQASTPS